MKLSLAMRTPLLTCVRYGLMLLAVAGVAALTTGAWYASALKGKDKDAARRHFHARVRDGLGREVRMSTPGANLGETRAAVNSAAHFIGKRSGVGFSGEALSRLAEMEQRAQAGTGRRVTVDELSNTLTSIMVEKLSALSDEQVAGVVETLRGFNAPGLPNKFDRDFKLPATAFVMTRPEVHEARIRAIRDQLATPSGDVFKGAAREFVRKGVESRVQILSEALPESFGNTWDAEAAEAGGMTPLQALLVAYSVVSDDYLCDSEASLAQRMKAVERSLSRSLGEPYPGPEGHRAYGVNGYLFSAPLDIVLDEQAVGRLLDRVEGGTRR